ncbi:MAG: sugar phosphate nucleotidyltransferase, partial [Longimicrobiales bacterium]
EYAGVIWAKEVEDFQRFGVIVRDAEGSMKRIVEKPTDPISKLANIGLYYIRDWKLLFKGIHATMEGPKGKSGEYYLTDAFQYMVDHGAKIRVEEVSGWYDCGQLETLIDTNRWLLENGRSRSPDGSRSVRIREPVRIEEDVKLENCEIGPNVTVESGSVLRHAKLRDCVIGRSTSLENVDLHDSMIGDNAIVRGVNGVLSIGSDAQVDGTT